MVIDIGNTALNNLDKNLYPPRAYTGGRGEGTNKIKIQYMTMEKNEASSVKECGTVTVLNLLGWPH